MRVWIASWGDSEEGTYDIIGVYTTEQRAFQAVKESRKQYKSLHYCVSFEELQE